MLIIKIEMALTQFIMNLEPEYSIIIFKIGVSI